MPAPTPSRPNNLTPARPDTPARGWCAHCGKDSKLFGAGLVQPHGPHEERCLGGRKPPATQPPPHTPQAPRQHEKRRPTPPQVAILRLVAQGFTNMEIGLQLFITMNTVKTQLRRAFHTLGARDRAHAVFLACGLGLIELPGTPGGAARRQKANTLENRFSPTIIELYTKNKLSIRRIGDRLGISYGTVHRVLDKNQVPLRRRGGSSGRRTRPCDPG